MRFQVAKQDLEAALQVVTPSQNSSGSDITAHYVFRRTGTEKGGYGVEVVTCSGRLFSSCPINKAKVEEAGKKAAFTIQGKRLKKWLQHVATAALTFAFDEDEGEVVAKAPKGQQTFQSLQPDSRFTWDAILKESKLTGTVDAMRLSNAIGYAKLFVSVKETEQPELCVAEVKDGILYSTDKKGVSLVRIAGVGDSCLRVHGKDVPSFQSFLNTFDGTSVEVLEHDRMLILRRGDGAVFGATRFKADFPGFNINMDDADQHVWMLSKEDIQEAVGFLVSGVSDEDNRLHFAPGEVDDTIELSMMSVTGKKTALTLNASSMEQADGAPDMPSKGFDLDHFCLAKVLGAWKGDEIRFGISLMGSRGFVRFVAEHDGDKYLTLFVWLK
jgi:hypothetical protein